jgi:hypothetical protein
MSQFQAFRRVPIPTQVAQTLETTTIPAPTRGLIMDENYAFMQPGAALVCDNWKPTMQGVSLRGGCIRHCVLPETTPVISMFKYASGNLERMFAGNATNLYDVTDTAPVLVQGGQGDGNYAVAQLDNQGGDYLIAVNDSGDPPLRFDGTSWEQLTLAYVPPVDKPSNITKPDGSALNFIDVCKYKSRLYFIEGGTMNAWYLPIDAVGGAVDLIPLSGSASKGGELMFCATWSLSTGDGLGDKIVFGTNLGELLVFTGSNPADASNWQQEGRYQSANPLGKNAHMSIGADLLLMTEQGIVPISACVNKSFEELELASITKPIKRMWRDEVAAKRQWAWTMENWENYGSIFVTTPGSTPGYCLIVNAATGAWARFVGYDATCFTRIRKDMFFGTQDGKIMLADRTGYDDGIPYTATLVGGWEMFQAPAQTIVWRQARASFASTAGQPFVPQLSACVDYVVTLPPPPPAGRDPGVADVWDEGLWGPDMGGPPPPIPTPPERLQYAQWDQPSIGRPIPRNTRWVSVGKTGFSHAPIVQITVAQQALPNVDLIAISATFERCGIDV